MGVSGTKKKKGGKKKKKKKKMAKKKKKKETKKNGTRGFLTGLAAATFFLDCSLSSAQKAYEEATRATLKKS